MKARTIYRTSLGALSVLAAVNAILAFWIVRRMRSPVHYNVQVVEPPRLELPAFPTNSVSIRSGLTSESSATVSDQREISHRSATPHCWRYEYHYCVVNGRRIACLNGVNVREGDTHAFGVVREIYPERIYFESGDYIENTKGVRHESRTATADE